MQTIENSLLQVSVDENGADLAHLISKNTNFDYFTNGETQEKAILSFPGEDSENNWMAELPWTVVDKGDARVSLTLIDTTDSYKKYPYHFEVMVTYAIEGNQLNFTLHVKNNSNKEMPFSFIMTLPKILACKEQNVSKVVLADDEHQVSAESAEFSLKATDDQVSFETGKITLAAEAEQKFNLTLTAQ